MENSELDKLAGQFDFPKKPRLGTLAGWILNLFFVLAAVICLSIRSDSVLVQTVWLLGALVAVIVFLALVVSDIRKFLREKREYALAQEDFSAYRIFKAVEFIAQNDANRKDAEMYVDWMKKHPDKKLPPWVETAILQGDSLTLQRYLETRDK